jgi:hypothetical protein
MDLGSDLRCAKSVVAGIAAAGAVDTARAVAERG